MTSRFKVGDQVILGRHDPDPSDPTGIVNWDPDMEKYVGKIAILIKTFIPHPVYGVQWLVDIGVGYAWHEKNMLPCHIITGFQVGDPMVVKQVVPMGAACSKCREFNNYGEPNQSDGSYKCYSCRH